MKLPHDNEMHMRAIAAICMARELLDMGQGDESQRYLVAAANHCAAIFDPHMGERLEDLIGRYNERLARWQILNGHNVSEGGAGVQA